MRWLPRSIRAVWRWLTTRGSTHPTTQADGGVDRETARSQQRDSSVSTLELSREQTVERLLTEQGGWLRQGEIITLTGWSPAKTSRVLSEMEAHDRVVRFEDGREKVVYAPTAAPESRHGSGGESEARGENREWNVDDN